MPISISLKDLSPLCKDYEFVVNDKDQLAELVTRLLMGHCRHVSKIIRALAPSYPNPDSLTIHNLLNDLDLNGKPPKYVEKVHGWLFQMISWIVLAVKHRDDEMFFQQYPHSQVAMQGMDGLAVHLNTDGSINRIIITEDKCTNNAQYIFKHQVLPEFEDYEKGKKNNAILQQVEALIRNDAILNKIENNILNLDYRQYRISITRQDAHDSDAGRNTLFKDYDQFVMGADVDRRTASSTNLGKMRDWMEDFRNLVIAKLSQL